MHSSLILFGVISLVLVRILRPFISTFFSPLRSIPGPFATRFSRLWYFRQIYGGQFHHQNIDLHHKYGPIVRVAPDLYSISAPDKQVYGIKSKFPKNDWYEGWKHPSPERWTLFPDSDIKRHGETRKRFQHLYSMSSLVSYEHYVDVCADIFTTRLAEFAKSGQVIDMAHWFQCYAFDVIGSITYSQRFGFLDRGEDVEGTLAALEKAMVYGTCVGIYAWAHPILYPILERFFPRSGAAGRSFVMRFVQQRLNARQQEREKGMAKEEKLEEGAVTTEALPEDFLNKMMNAHDEDPDKVTDYHVFMMGLSNIFAGSDTTAVSLSSTLYHLLKYPNTMKKLREEIETAEQEGRCDKTRITFAESQNMPYLQACLKEALRLHSATGLPLWRVVTEGGAEIQGQYFPAGTTVGINTWVAHFDETIFGTDVKEFRPERWIEAEENDAEKLKVMEQYYMPFGLGSRTCLGKHISFLEMNKLIPRIVKSFDFVLEVPNKEWHTQNYWFVKPVDFRLRVRGRDQR